MRQAGAYLAADIQEKDGELVILLVRKNLQFFCLKNNLFQVDSCQIINHRDSVPPLIAFRFNLVAPAHAA